MPLVGLLCELYYTDSTPFIRHQPQRHRQKESWQMTPWSLNLPIRRYVTLCTHLTGLNVKGTESCNSTWAWKLAPTITIVTLIFFGSEAHRLTPIFKVELLLFYKNSHNNTIQ